MLPDPDQENEVEQGQMAHRESKVAREKTPHPNRNTKTQAHTSDAEKPSMRQRLGGIVHDVWRTFTIGAHHNANNSDLRMNSWRDATREDSQKRKAVKI